MTQKRRLLTLLLSAFSLLFANAQSYFQKSYGSTFFEQTVALEALSNGHMVLAGFSTKDVTGDKNIWLMRVNANGQKIWAKTLSLSQSCSATAIQKTSDGNLLVTYNATGSTVTPNTSGWLKISTDGAIIWAKKAIGNSALYNIAPSATGGYLLSGQSFTANGTQVTGLVVRIGEDGLIQWSSAFGENGASIVHDCWEDPSGFIHCVGYTSEAGGNRNGFWAKLGADGELLGPVKRFGSSDDDELIRLVPMGTNKLLLSGYTHGFGNSAYSSVWTVVTDYDGNLKQSNTFSLAENSISTYDLIALPGDQYLLAIGLLTGQLSPAILCKLSFDLDQLFAWQYKGGQEADAFLQVIRNGSGFAAVGATYNNGDANGYLVSTDADGQLQSEDCCPKQLDITRKDVTPETAAFIPTQTAFYAVQNVVFEIKDLTVNTLDLCQPIGLEFTVSSDTICPGECINITVVDSTAGVQYSFEYQGGEANPDSLGQVCHTSGPVLFITRKGSNGNCEKSLTKRVVLGGKRDQFPNAFSPNGDGANDLFKPVFGCPAESMHFQIFNRWGKRVYDSTDPLAGWDGNVSGTPADSDVYAWKLEYEVEINGSREKLQENGEVTLIR